jgi:serine/threonine protein kinase
MPLEPGQTVGRYRVEEMIGAGGMGIVYEAFDREQQRLVALKVLHHAQQATRARLVQDFAALRTVAHPNLVDLGELCDEDGRCFFTMELVGGPELAARAAARCVAQLGAMP